MSSTVMEGSPRVFTWNRREVWEFSNGMEANSVETIML